MTMRERKAAGLSFTDECEGMDDDRLRCKELCYDFNHLRPSERERKYELQKELFGEAGSRLWIEPPMRLCYGYNVEFKGGFYGNTNMTLIDDYKITIGDGTMFGSNVTVATVNHVIHPSSRAMYCMPVSIGANCWIGSGVTICAGVSIGDNTVIGAGSVVTKDIPANVVAVGNPCKVLREITEEDLYYNRHRYKIGEDGLETE